MLISGAAGLGKEHYAKQVAQLLLCEQPNQQHACQHCASCQLYHAGNHPDFYFLGLEENSKIIKVDAIRNLISKLAQTAQRGGYKVVLISPADAMNVAASNALLKTLEEPSTNTTILLVTARPESLPATIRSRCQSIAFALPESKVSQQWLQQQHSEDVESTLALYEQVPLAALNFINNDELQQQYQTFMQAATQWPLEPLKLAQLAAQLPVQSMLSWLQQLYMDLIRLQFQTDISHLAHQRFVAELQHFAKQLTHQQSYSCLEQIQQIQKLIRQQPNLNLQLQLEALFIHMLRVYER